jgi:uncharacterized membrane protein YkvA (DUF1232 family)
MLLLPLTSEENRSSEALSVKVKEFRFINDQGEGVMFEKWKQYARKLKIEINTLYLAYKDPRVPLFAKLFTAAVVGYAFSPIDMIPDFIPVIGYLDDLVIIPLGIILALKMIPPDVLIECRSRAEAMITTDKPINKAAAVAIIVIWVLVAIMLLIGFVRLSGKSL